MPPAADLLLTIGDLRFALRLERARAPRSCEALLRLLPLERHALQARWSGRAAWIPLGVPALDVPPEDATSHPLPGELLLYPGGVSEPELLLPYGATRFASVAGQLAGNPCCTIVDGLAQLEEVGRRVQWLGAQPCTLRRAGGGAAGGRD